MQVRAQLAAAAEGLLGYSLDAKILANQYWTLSAWETRAALMRFVGAQPHREIMTAMRPHIGPTAFVEWPVTPADLPLRWAEAHTRLAARG